MWRTKGKYTAVSMTVVDYSNKPRSAASVEVLTGINRGVLSICWPSAWRV